MRILFLHEVGYFEKPIFEMHEFPEHLAELGHEVAFVEYRESVNFRNGDSFGFEATGRVVPDAKIYLYSQTAKLPGVAGRIVAALFFPVFFLRVLRRFRPDVVVSYSVPTSGWQALCICKALRIPFVYRSLDVSHLIRKTWLQNLVLFSEKFVIRGAQLVSANNLAMRDYVISMGAEPVAVNVHLPPSDLTHFLEPPVAQNELRVKLGIPSSARIYLYMGSFFYFSGLEFVIESFAAAEDDEFLVLVGGGDQDQELRKMASLSPKSDQIVFTGSVPYADLPSYLGLASVTINPMVRTLAANAAIPNKIIQYMASGKLVVSTELEGVVRTFGCLKGVETVDDPRKVFLAARKMALKGTGSVHGKDNQKFVREVFNLHDRLADFEGALLSVAAR